MENKKILTTTFFNCNKYAMQRNELFNSIFRMKNLCIVNTHVLLWVDNSLSDIENKHLFQFVRLFRSPESLRWPIAMGGRPSSSVVRRAFKNILVPNPFAERSCYKICSNQRWAFPTHMYMQARSCLYANTRVRTHHFHKKKRKWKKEERKEKERALSVLQIILCRIVPAQFL